MQWKEVEIGHEYGYRRRRGDGQPLEHVRVLEVVQSRKGRRFRVEWCEGDEVGITDLVDSAELIAPWRERRAFLDEERGRLVLQASIGSIPSGTESVIAAIDMVLLATGEGIETYQGILSCDPDVLDRIATRAGIGRPEHYAAYTDRRGTLHLPWVAALELAESFAAAEPGIVLTYVDAVEHDAQSEAEAGNPSYPSLGRTYFAQRFAETAAANALVRRWTGQNAEIERRDLEIKRLREGIRDRAWRLRRGNDPERVATAGPAGAHALAARSDPPSREARSSAMIIRRIDQLVAWK